MLRAPVHKRLGSELGLVVRPQGQGTAVGRPPTRPRRRMTRRLGNESPIAISKPFSIPLIDHRQQPDPPAIVERLAHEVERPGSVQYRRRRQRLPHPARYPPRGPTRQIQAAARNTRDARACGSTAGLPRAAGRSTSRSPTAGSGPPRRSGPRSPLASRQLAGTGGRSYAARDSLTTRQARCTGSRWLPTSRLVTCRFADGPITFGPGHP